MQLLVAISARLAVAAPEPIAYEVAPDGCVRLGLAPEECLAAVQDAWAEWEAVPCLGVASEFVGGAPDTSPEPDASVVRFLFGHDVRSVGEPSVHLSDGTAWVTRQSILDGECAAEFDLTSALAHEIGHLLGLDHTLHENEPLTGGSGEEALMFWTLSPCEVRGINEADRSLAYETHGPWADVVCLPEPDSEGRILGEAPMTVRCAAATDTPEWSRATWSFGDGPPVEGPSAAHTYAEAGGYVIEATLSGTRETCGADGFEVEARNVVRVELFEAPEGAGEDGDDGCGDRRATLGGLVLVVLVGRRRRR